VRTSNISGFITEGINTAAFFSFHSWCSVYH